MFDWYSWIQSENSWNVVLERKEKFVAFCRSKPACWYNTTPVQKHCKKNFLIERRWHIAAGGFHPHWVSTLHLVFFGVIGCSIFLVPVYCSDTQINDPHLKNILNYKTERYIQVSLIKTANICINWKEFDNTDSPPPPPLSIISNTLHRWPGYLTNWWKNSLHAPSI